MGPVRVGVIGCGVIGSRHLASVQRCPGAEIAAVADLRDELAQEAAKEFNVPRVYPSGEALIADPEVQAVVLAMPARGRKELALMAFERGKHVLTEKPVAMNAAEVREMIAAKGDLIAGCCSSRVRQLDSARVVTELIATGVLGEIRSIHCRCMMALRKKRDTPPPAWRLKKSLNAGGILVNWGCYDLDYLLGITGWLLRPETVLSQVWTVPAPFESYVAAGSDAETHFTALIRCGGGKVITIERAEYVAATPSDTWKIVGDHASLHLVMVLTEDTKIILDKADPEKGLLSEVVWSADEKSGQSGGDVTCDFVQAVQENRPCKTSLEQALIIQQITDAVYQSAETGEAVRISQ